jgi:SAM-dependent methyltransferase
MSATGRARALVRPLVPYGRRPQLRRLYNLATWRFYAGDRVRCNCCRGRFRRFRRWTSDVGRPALACPRCGALGRHRVDWMYLVAQTNLLTAPLRLLHVAPEPGLEVALRRLGNVEYLSADFDSRIAMERMDIMDIGYPERSFDAIICNHVLEHVDDDRIALRELFRVLGPLGWALLQTPIDRSIAVTVEDPHVTDPREREFRFGQRDHCRRYGADYLSRLQQAGFSVTADAYARGLPRSVQEEFGLDVDETIYLARRPV